MRLRLLPLLGILFFILQVYFCLWGRDYFDVFENPIGLFLSFAGLGVCYFISICQTDFASFHLGKQNRVFVFGMLVFCGLLFTICIPELNDLFIRISEPIKISDVLPQLDAQYNHFAKGESPYQVVELPNHSPYPVYMPLHWLPIFISRILNLDTRWSGAILLLFSIAIFVFFSVRTQKNLIFNLLCIVAPVSILYVFTKWGDADIAITYETVIAAYYLILAFALMQKNIWLIVLGIVFCLLSRYTFIFWLPLFFMLFYLNEGMRKTGIIITTIIVLFSCIYVFPFLLKDPSIFLRGLKYHNEAAVAEWSGGAYTFYSGVYFGPHINSLVVGNPEHKVFVARVIQASTMLLLLFLGLLFYKKNKLRTNHYEISLGMLYAFIVCFYLFGPLTYRYYMLVPLYLSVVLLARVLLAEKRISQVEPLN